VGDRDGRTNKNDDGGEISVPERQRIERHLDQCAACCRYQSDLEGAMGALVAAAAELPVEPQAPSLWPALYRRIQDFHQPVPSRWTRLARTVAESWVRKLSDFAADQPMRRAWARDCLRAIFPSRQENWIGLNQSVGRVLGLGIVASVLIAMTVIPGVWREWKTAQYTINTNTSPLVDHGAAPRERVLELPSEPSRLDDREKQDELAQSDVARPVEPSAGVVNSTPEPKPATHARYGYDLEHGIPMPPDARESKPVY